MCGIVGMLLKRPINNKRIEDFAEATKLINHRGPDHHGTWNNSRVFLSHFRLSILDLDPRSHQPFFTRDQQLMCVYNGELYNYLDIKDRYQLHTHTSSDTEIVLESFRQHGNDVVKEWNGMFALGIYNQRENKFTLIRDRLGIKPLYVYEDEDVFLFASEAKVIYQWLPEFRLNDQVLSEFIWFGNGISNETMVKGVRKLPAGHILDINLNDFSKFETEYKPALRTNPVQANLKEALKQTSILLENSVRRHLISDVPIGILLSGGVDSSAIVAYASRNSAQKLDTYTVDFDYNLRENVPEINNARIVARKFGTNHHELRVDSINVPEIFDQLVFQYDEPFADAANIPLYYLTKLCSKDKKVILQGDGGDEVYGGYRSYNMLASLNFWRMVSFGGSVVHPDPRWRERFNRMLFVLGQKTDAARMSYLMTEETPYKGPYEILSEDKKNAVKAANPFFGYEYWDSIFKQENRVQKMLFVDLNILLSHSYLEKVDKATMLCSVESRVPFLDNELVEYVTGLDSKLKIRSGVKKFLLKQSLRGIIPNDILFGKKKGFGVPFRQWLKTNLFEYAMESFSDTSLQPYLNNQTLLNYLELHKKGTVDYGPLLWKSLVLCSWIRRYQHKLVD